MSDIQAFGKVKVERLTRYSGTDLDDLSEATESAIVEGGGFGWLKPPPRQLLENYWKGVLLVPERRLVVGRLDGVICGSAQLSRAPRNNEAQAMAGTVTSAFVAPWARGPPDRAAVILYPAIDLKGGACVRLVRGEMASATVFNTDPAAQARHFAEAGFSWLHVVDLDGAFAGHSVNGEAVRAIRQAIDLKIQLGGGIRDRAAIDNWLELGIDRVVLGTAALRDPTLVREAGAAYPGQVAVAIDARD